MISLTVYSGNTPQGTIEVTDSDTFPLAITKSNSDFRDISKRRGVFSKNFKILATANNNRVLKYIYNANVTAQVYRDCVLTYNNAEILRGKIQCLNVSQTKQGEEYNLVVYADSVDWYFLLNGKLISEYDYGNEEIPSFGLTNGQPSGVIPASNTSTLSRAYIEASWRNKDKFDYVYNLVSYGQPINGTFVAEEDLRPSIYIGKMLAKAFAGIGYVLESDFFTTGIGASLILQYTGDGFNAQNLNSFQANTDTSIRVSTDPLPPARTVLFYRLIPNLIISNPNSIYNNLTGLITIPSIGIYTFSINCSVRVFTIGGFVAVLSQIIIRDSVTLVEYVAIDSNNPSPLQSLGAYEYDFLADSTPTQIPQGTYEIVFKFVADSVVGNTTIISLLPNGSFIQTIDESITVEQTYNVGLTLPEYKVLDILSGLQNMFNLYFQTDNLNKTVRIEPKPVLIQPISQGVDYSSKLDVQNQLTTEFISSYNRYLRFRFKEDSKDGFQTAFNLERGSIFGSVQYDLGTDFKEGFSDTGSSYFAATIIYDRHPFVPIGEQCPIPVLWKDNAPSPPKEYGFEPRILYYKGYEDVFLANGRKAAWNWLGTLLTTLPSSFMIDPNVNEPSPVNILYSDSTTANGLARTYYNSDIAVIMDKRIHKCYFRITATEFYKLNLYKPIFLDHVNYRGWYYINQVTDFSPNKETTVLFELIRAYDSLPNNRPIAGEIPTIQGGIRPRTEMGGGTLTSGLQATNESAVLHNGSGNVGLIKGGGVVMGNGGRQSTINQHVFGNYNFPNTSIWVVGAGSLDNRYNGLQFTQDGRILQHGGKIYVDVDGSLRDVLVEMEVDGVAEFSETYLTGER